jgi:nitrite reductase/ring-hydroxylating ferredoxin subunit/uncharacterized membrane protein
MSLLDRLAHDPRLDAPAIAAGRVVDAVLGGDAPLRKRIKSALNGTWLGHPLHPLLTDIPIGAWTVGAIADALALGGDERAAAAADIATAIGVGGAVAAAWAGWADWSDTDGDGRRLGIAHAMTNGAALSLYVLSLGLRRAKQRGSATASAWLGFTLVGLGGYLGGELAFGRQLGMRRTSEPVDPPEEFVRVAALADVPERGFRRVEADGIPLLVARTENDVRATSAICTHAGLPLETGTREGDCVRCPWHGSLFALDDGAALEGPATFGLTVYDTRVTGTDLEVRGR